MFLPFVSEHIGSSAPPISPFALAWIVLLLVPTPGLSGPKEPGCLSLGATGRWNCSRADRHQTPKAQRPEDQKAPHGRLTMWLTWEHGEHESRGVRHTFVESTSGVVRGKEDSMRNTQVN